MASTSGIFSSVASILNSAGQSSLAVMLIALTLGGFIASAKGIYSENYWMIAGGWIAAAVAVAVGTVWIVLGHLPFLSENTDPLKVAQTIQAIEAQL